MSGSNPSLLRSAILFLICVGFSVFCVEPTCLQKAINFIIGGASMSNFSHTAVIFAILKSLFRVFSAVTAGLVANGVTPHLYKHPLARVLFFAPRFVTESSEKFITFHE